jgi:hypothetical protein
MAVRHFLQRWGIELRHFHMIPLAAPHYHWIKTVEFCTRKWNALQAWVFIKATCNFPEDGLLCDVVVEGKHEFLTHGGSTTHQGQLWL